jgi:cytochrome c oxidase subunit 3
MSDSAPTVPGEHAAAVPHEDPMSHVPPGSLWPLLVTGGLTVVPFGVVSLLGCFNQTPIVGPLQNPMVGLATIIVGGLIFVFCLMGWAHQVIREKLIAHDVVAQQKDLQFFILLFLTGELMAFSAVFGYFYHRTVQDPHFGPPEGMEFGGAMVAYATFILLSSSVTCEFAHHALQAGRMLMAKALFLGTIVLGGIFLAMQGYEWGELLQRGFRPVGDSPIANTPAASFASIFYTGTGFHGLHVAIGLVMLFMVLMRLEFGHFRGKRHYAVVAASWYWHFVDIVWVLLFITIYVVR